MNSPAHPDSPSLKPAPIHTLLMACICASLLVFGLLVDTSINNNPILSQTLPDDPQASVELPKDPRLEEALQWFTPVEILKGKKFRAEKLRAHFNHLILSLSFIIFIIGSLWIRPLWKLSQKFSGTFGIFVFVGLFFLLYWIILYPEIYYGSFALEKQYQLSNENFEQFFRHFLKIRVFSLLLWMAGFSVLVLFIKKYPQKWFLYAGICTWLALVFLTFIRPLVLDPWLYSFRPLPSGDLRENITQLCQESGINPKNILIMEASKKTTRVNAYFTGVGPSKRIVLYDNLIEKHPTAEVQIVMAHELGHWKHKHIFWGLTLALPAILLGFWGIHMTIHWIFERKPFVHWIHVEPDLRYALLLPILLGFYLILSLFIGPFGLAISRHFERQADRYALELTKNPQHFIEKQVRITKQNLGDPLPHPLFTLFFASHPSPLDRIRMAQETKHSSALPR